LPLTRKESLKAPLRVGEGFGEGSDPSLIDQQLHAIRPYMYRIIPEAAVVILNGL
jgi:hypothetical protein